jgi:hypothetical protein
LSDQRNIISPFCLPGAAKSKFRLNLLFPVDLIIL